MAVSACDISTFAVAVADSAVAVSAVAVSRAAEAADMAVCAVETAPEAADCWAGLAASTAVFNVTVALSILVATEVTVGESGCGD